MNPLARYRAAPASLVRVGVPREHGAKGQGATRAVQRGHLAHWQHVAGGMLELPTSE